MVRLLPTILAVIMLMSHIEKTTQIAPFCVTRSSNIDSSSITDFDAECFEPSEEPSGFDLVTDTFSPPVTGLYWLHFTAGLPDTGDFTDVQLALPTRTINIYRSAGGPEAVSSRSDIVELTAGVDRLQLSSAGGQFSNVSDVQVSWSGFHLDSMMSNVAAFSVAMSPGTFAGPAFIPFDIVFVDTHNCWDYDRYDIPVTGLWVISVHIANHPQEENSVAYTMNYPSTGAIFGILSGFKYGSDMNAVTFVIFISDFLEDLSAKVESGYSVYSDFHYQTAMSGFLYSPVVQPAVAWTAVLNREITLEGPLDPLPFEGVKINEGNGFNMNTSTFIAPHGGLYYVAIAGKAYALGMKMELLLNGNMKASVYHEEEQARSRSRAIILRLSVGDELRVRIPAGYEVHSWKQPEDFTVFTGFRISP